MDIELIEQPESSLGEIDYLGTCFTRVAEGEPVRLSFAQEQLWFLQQLEPTMTAYNLPRIFKLTGYVNLGALERAFKAVINRHSILRTKFFERDGVPMQVVQSSASFDLKFIDLSSCEPSGRDKNVNQIVKEIVSFEFDLSCAPAMVASLIKLDNDEQILAVCLHHIVSDAWSNPILARDLSDAYRYVLLHDKEPNLTPMPLQYIDYALWQRDYEKNEGLVGELEYWNRYLGDNVPPLNMPIDFQRQKNQSFKGAAIDFKVSTSFGERLNSFCRAERCTPFVVLLSAWQIVLARYSGQEEFAIGVPSSGRSCEEVQELMGFFVTTQVYRSRVAPEISLRHLCRQVRSDALAALDHSELPFDLLLANRNDTREMGRSPIFQVMFGMQISDEMDSFDLEGLLVESVEYAHQSAKYELSLDITIGKSQSGGILEYNTELFSENSAQRLVDHYLSVLGVIISDPDRTVQRLDFLNDTDKKQLINWGINRTRYPYIYPVHCLMEQQVQDNPDHIALIFDHQQLTYAELNERSNRLAHYLMGLGVKPEVRVGICVERSIEMVVGLLAILKAGGAYVPLDPDYPQDRLSYMIDDSGIDLLLTQSTLKESLPFENVPQVIELDDLDLSKESTDNPQAQVHGENLAYVIYTSGSTGRPKGVGIPHRCLVEHSQVSVEFFGLTAADRMLQFSTLNFDGCIEQLFPPLLSGATMVLRGPELWDSATFLYELLDKKISVVDITTAYWLLLVQDFARQNIRDYGVLRQLHAGGEAMPPEGIKAWQEAGLRHVKLLNTYGPTEATVTATILNCAPYIDEKQALPLQMPIGTPLSGRSLYVVDESLNRVPQGVTGELCIGGDLLARCYLNRADLSAERFIANPFNEMGGRLYRTGDLVCWNKEGQLDYLGRIDHQVKIRGFRIELGEIEAEFLSQTEVREAVVVANESTRGSRLIGYVSSVADQTIDTVELRERLGKTLPDYMVPSVIMVLDELPLNANGKVDRKVLPEPEMAHTAKYEAPQGEVEKMLAQIWSEVLGVERVGRHDNFFELGGHSLSILKLQTKVQQMFSVRSSLSMYFENPVFYKLAESISNEIDNTSDMQDLEDMSLFLDQLES